MNTSHCIPADPDISGIGVRTVIYAQNILSFVPALYALADGKVTISELDSVETQSMTILITAFAILVSAIIQALSLGVSNFHLSIILDLSWMNNTTTFIYFLLYVQHKVQAERDDALKPMELKWSVWIEHVFRAFRSIVPHSESVQKSDTAAVSVTTRRSCFRRLFTKFVLIIGSVHLSLMAAIGIWLWSHPTTFSISSPCASEATVLFGQTPVASNTLRVCSIILYAIFLLPLFNMILPILGLLSIVIHWPRIRRWLQWLRSPLAATKLIEPRRSSFPSIAPIRAGLGILFLIDIFFIIDIKTTIRANTSRRDPGDNEWTFGQTLALMLLLVPLRDIVDTILERREVRLQQAREIFRREKAWEEDEKIKKQSSDRESLEEAVRLDDIPLICELVKNGADPNVIVTCVDEDSIHRTPLERVISSLMKHYRLRKEDPAHTDSVNMDSLRLLLEKGANPDLQPGMGEHLLLRGCKDEFTQLVHLLLDAGVDPTPSALSLAIETDNVGLTRALLAKGADPNQSSSSIETPLSLAVIRRNYTLVSILLTSGAEVDGSGALHEAIDDPEEENQEIVRLLLDNGQSPHWYSRSKVQPSPLVEAIEAGKLSVVEILLERGARLTTGQDSTERWEDETEKDKLLLHLMLKFETNPLGMLDWMQTITIGFSTRHDLHKYKRSLNIALEMLRRHMKKHQAVMNDAAVLVEDEVPQSARETSPKRPEPLGLGADALRVLRCCKPTRQNISSLRDITSAQEYRKQNSLSLRDITPLQEPHRQDISSLRDITPLQDYRRTPSRPYAETLRLLNGD